LGFAGYYRNIVKNYGKIASPLTSILKNNAFNWTPTTNHAFQALKVAMCTSLVLALPDFNKTFVVECDASRKGIGVFLMKYGRPLDFTNKQLAILHAVDIWCPYLMGQHFQIKYDHQNLKYFLKQRISSLEQQKWVTKLFGYDYEFIYKKGKENVVVDSISKKYEEDRSLFSLSFIVID
jgi:hypothetical protein